MSMNRRAMLRAALGAAVALPYTSSAWSASATATAGVPAGFPDRPVRVIVPIAAGGSADKLARVIAQKLGDRWKQAVVVQNMPGASSVIGNAYVAHAQGDGYTLLLGSESLSLNAVQMGASLPYDPLRQLRGVTKAVVNPQLLVVRTNLGVKTYAEFAQLVKSKPGEITLGLPGGAGSLQDLAVTLLDQRIGARTNHIPYPGGGPAMLDVLGGHVDSMLITLAAATENVRAGKLVPLAVTTAQRSKALPDVPTLEELGVTGYVVESWQGLVAPATTPDAIVQKINRDVVAVLRDQATSEQLESLGYSVAASSADEVDSTVAGDIRKYGKIVASAV